MTVFNGVGFAYYLWKQFFHKRVTEDSFIGKYLTVIDPPNQISETFSGIITFFVWLPHGDFQAKILNSKGENQDLLISSKSPFYFQCEGIEQ